MDTKIKIFLFHRISPVRDMLWDPVSPELFDTIVKYIKRKYEVISLDNILMYDINSIKFNKPLCAIVFDDGYKDYIDYALPILNKNNCTSSMYVVTDCIENQIPPWTYVLDYHLLESSLLELKLNTTLLPQELRKTKFSSKEERINYAKKIKPYLKTIDNNNRVELYEQIISSLDDVQIPTNLIMNWEDLKQIKTHGIEIGSHSKTHALLGKINDRDSLIEELEISGNIIKEKLGYFPSTISYPNGSYNNEVKKTALECGYKIGLSVNQLNYNSSKHDNFEIPRIELYNESILKTQMRIVGLVQKLNSWFK